MSPTPKPQTAAFLFKQMPEDEDSDTNPILVSDTIKRLGRLEMQTTQMLPILGRVAEAVDNLNVGFEDMKSDIKGMVAGFTTMRIDTANYNSRLSTLECKANKHDTQELEDLEEAKLKAEAVLEESRIKAAAVLEEARVAKKERRNKIVTLAGTAIASIISAAIITWLKLK